jgi:gamma-glutamylcyclotransferase (GGCT)/AIG2-like uncharacterized protein YtfP
MSDGAWYFAYGSNMQSATFRGRRGIEWRRAVAARLSGWRLVVDKPPLVPIGEAYANIVADPAGEVFGVLYEIAAADLAHIDLTEGVLIGNYRRITALAVPLDPIHGGALTAHTLTSDRQASDLRPSTRYMSLVVEGALEHGLPAHYVEWLRSIPAQAETAEAARFRPLLDQLMKRSG